MERWLNERSTNLHMMPHQAVVQHPVNNHMGQPQQQFIIGSMGSSLIPLQRTIQNYERSIPMTHQYGIERNFHPYIHSSNSEQIPQYDANRHRDIPFKRVDPVVQYSSEMPQYQHYLANTESSSFNQDTSPSERSSASSKEKKQKAVKSSSQVISKSRRSSYGHDKPKPSLDTFVRYPVLFQNQMNCADSQAFMDSFRDKCEEGFVAMGYYVDAHGKVMHQRALRANIGWVQYKRYLEDLFKFIPDAVFMAVDTTFVRNDHEIVVCSEFLYAGTYMVLQPKEETKALKELECSSSTNCPISCDGVDFSNIFLGDDVEDEVPPGVVEDESYLSQMQMPPPNMDWSIMTNINNNNSNNSQKIHRNEEKSQDGHYQWVPAAAPPSEEAGKYILGQFVPSKPKELVLPRDAPFSVAKSSEVSIRGKFRFYINSTSYLIRRIEFAYQQDSSDNTILGGTY